MAILLTFVRFFQFELVPLCSDPSKHGFHELTHNCDSLCFHIDFLKCRWIEFRLHFYFWFSAAAIPVNVHIKLSNMRWGLSIVIGGFFAIPLQRSQLICVFGGLPWFEVCALWAVVSLQYLCSDPNTFAGCCYPSAAIPALLLDVATPLQRSQYFCCLQSRAIPS